MKLLGIDYGLKKIGLAIGDTETRLAEPLAVIKTAKSKKQIANICQKEKIEKVVIGLPESGIVEKIKDFSRELANVSNLPVIYQEEVLTTKDAIAKMIQAGKARRKRQIQEDAVAAAILLEDYLEKNNV